MSKLTSTTIEIFTKDMKRLSNTDEVLSQVKFDTVIARWDSAKTHKTIKITGKMRVKDAETNVKKWAHLFGNIGNSPINWRIS